MNKYILILILILVPNICLASIQNEELEDNYNNYYYEIANEFFHEIQKNDINYDSCLVSFSRDKAQYTYMFYNKKTVFDEKSRIDTYNYIKELYLNWKDWLCQ